MLALNVPINNLLLLDCSVILCYIPWQVFLFFSAHLLMSLDYGNNSLAPCWRGGHMIFSYLVKGDVWSWNLRQHRPTHRFYDSTWNSLTASIYQIHAAALFQRFYCLTHELLKDKQLIKNEINGLIKNSTYYWYLAYWYLKWHAALLSSSLRLWVQFRVQDWSLIFKISPFFSIYLTLSPLLLDLQSVASNTCRASIPALAPGWMPEAQMLYIFCQ